MSEVETLKAKIHAAVEQETSTDLLKHVQKFLDHPPISAELEASLAEGVDDLNEGRSISLEEFIKQGKTEAEERTRRYSA